MEAVLYALLLQTAVWSGLVDDDWTYRGESTETVVYTRADPRNDHRLWVRLEYAPEPNAMYRSSRSLVEADCADGRLRSLQTTGFTEPNLAGRSGPDESGGEWFYPGPRTINGAVLDLICASLSAR